MAAAAAAGALIGAAGSLGSTVLNNLFGKEIAEDNYWYAKKLAQEDRAENYYYNEQAAINADARARKMYNDIYSPEALLNQYYKAGLSPSLMFGGTPGQGGTTGAQGAGAGGPMTQFTPRQMYGIDPLVGAQIANLLAEANKTNKEAEQIEPLSESQIVKNLADAGHAEAAEAALKAQTAGQELDNYIKQETKEASIYQICAYAEKAAFESEKMYHEMRSAKVLAEVDEATYQQQVKIRIETLNNLISNTAKNNKEVEQIQQDMEHQIYNWDIEYRKLDIQEQQQTSYAQFVNKQCEKIEKELEFEAQRLGIEKTEMWIHAVTDVLKDVAIGAMAFAQFRTGAAKPAQMANKAVKDISNKKYRFVTSKEKHGGY